jgi:glycosyltransferase involved in cell wall biosynthesis
LEKDYNGFVLLFETNLNITWVHDYNKDQYLGGAELSDFYWIEKGKEIGFHISEITSESGFIDADLFVVSNAIHIPKSTLERITASKNYVVIFHGAVTNYDVPNFIENAKRVVFMSPAHLIKNQGDIPNSNVCFSAPYIDHTLFKPVAHDPIVDGKKSLCYIGAFEWHKGIKSICHYIRSHPEVTCDFYGWGRPDVVDYIKEFERCAVREKISYNDIGKIMNQFDGFIWFLERFGSYGRTLIEAHLCGLEVIANRDRFGLYSYDWNFDDRSSIIEGLKSELNLFWPKIL